MGVFQTTKQMETEDKTKDIFLKVACMNCGWSGDVSECEIETIPQATSLSRIDKQLCPICLASVQFEN